MKTICFVRRTLIFGLSCFFLSNLCLSQKDVMMQAFFWEVPTDINNKQGIWWDILRSQTFDLKEAGFTALWIPPPCKGIRGIQDVGYGIYDHYDLGAYYQNGSIETRYGSKTELLKLLATAHNPPSIDVYADILLDHMIGAFSDSSGLNNEESNPAVKA